MLNLSGRPSPARTVMTHRIYTTSVASVYPHYLAKAERKGRTKAEVDEIIRWLTGFSQAALEAQLAANSDFATFFAEAPMNPARTAITGAVCGVRVEEVAEPLMREIRYLDKLIDELAKGKAMDKILRGRAPSPSSPSAPASAGPSGRSRPPRRSAPASPPRRPRTG